MDLKGAIDRVEILLDNVYDDELWVRIQVQEWDKQIDEVEKRVRCASVQLVKQDTSHRTIRFRIVASLSSRISDPRRARICTLYRSYKIWRIQCKSSAFSFDDKIVTFTTVQTSLSAWKATPRWLFHFFSFQTFDGFVRNRHISRMFLECWFQLLTCYFWVFNFQR